MGNTCFRFTTTHSHCDIKFLFVHSRTVNVANALKERLVWIAVSNTCHQQQACHDTKSVKVQLQKNVPDVIPALK